MIGKPDKERRVKNAVQLFYSTRQWIRARDAYKSRVIYCERCGDVGDEVHHKIRLTPANLSDPMIAFDESNLELLCVACHEKEHGKREKRTDAWGHVELDAPRSKNEV